MSKSNVLLSFVDDSNAKYQKKTQLVVSPTGSYEIIETVKPEGLEAYSVTPKVFLGIDEASHKDALIAARKEFFERVAKANI